MTSVPLATVEKASNCIKHPNAHSLSIVTVLGWKVITGLNEYRDGDLIVYIRPDSIIPDDLIEKLQLGYLKKGSRLKTIRLRGYISQGLVLPVKIIKESLRKEGKDVSEYLNITKWEPPAPSYQKNSKARPARYCHPDFSKYTKIQNIKNYNRVFKADDEVYVSEKIHGCLFPKTKINLPNGQFETIENIVNNKVKQVMGYDINNKIVPVNITNWYNNGNTTEWYYILTKRVGQHGDSSIANIKCTSEHKFYNPKSKKYIAADKLNIHDKIMKYKHGLKLSYTQEQILIGKMLGDGCLQKNSVEFRQKKADKSYVKYTLKCLGDIRGNQQKDVISGYGTLMERGRTISDVGISYLFKNWFIDNVKQVPSDIQLSPISLAFWYMDDGSLSHDKNQEDRALFATCNFNENSINNLLIALNKFGISGKKYISENKHWRIRLNKDDALILFALIAPYVPDFMQYKLPEKYRNYNNYEFNHLTSERTLNIPIESTITQIKKLSTQKEFIKYDIETETGNYFANDTLVHNSNVRYGNLKIAKAKGFFNFFRYYWNLWTKKKYEFVYGSHNVQLSNTNKKSFYKENVYLSIAKCYNLANVIPKDTILYGEIFGPGIQKGYDYSLKEIDIRFFDVKVNGKYVNVIECKRIIKELGLLMTPELYCGILMNVDLNNLKSGPSVFDPNQKVREGCVVKSINEVNDFQVGRKILKCINETYLLNKNNTDFH